MKQRAVLKICGQAALPAIQELWNALNQHHAVRSSFFSGYYRSRCFEDRVSEIVSRGREVRVAIALVDSIPFGYCISSAVKGGEGEIDSIYICPETRGRGAGDLLMEDALDWLFSMETSSQVLSVYEGNEEAGSFYRRHGFFPKFTVYEKICAENVPKDQNEPLINSDTR